MTYRLASLVLLASLSLTRLAHPEVPSISSYFRTIVVESGQTVDEITCTGCSVEIRGAAEGDVITFGGDILLSGRAKGDVVALGGSVHLLPRAFVEGDATAIAGSVRQDPEARISGDTDSIPYLHLPGQHGFQVKGVFTFLCVNVALAVLTALILRAKHACKLAAVLSEHPLTALATGLATLLLGLQRVEPFGYELEEEKRKAGCNGILVLRTKSNFPMGIHYGLESSRKERTCCVVFVQLRLRPGAGPRLRCPARARDGAPGIHSGSDRGLCRHHRPAFLIDRRDPDLRSGSNGRGAPRARGGLLPARDSLG